MPTNSSVRILGAHRLKGITDAVRVWLVVRECTDAECFEAKQSALVACVGRDAELGVLLNRWQLAMSGTGQALVVSGDAGIGKSCLVAHLRAHLTGDAHTCLRLQCSEHHRNSPLYPIIAYLRRASGFEPEDLPALKLEKIERMLAQADNSMGAPLVAALLSVPFCDRYLPLALPAARQRTLTLELLVDQVFGLAANRQVLVLVEDVQWIDPTTEEALIRLLDRLQEHRVLLLLVTRRDYASPLIDHPRAMTLLLGPLSRVAAEQLVFAVTHSKALPKDLMEQILEKTDGVPLFIEELTKTVLESGLLREEGDTYALDEPLGAVAIPSTLQDSLKARLDRLSSDKEVVQVGAAIGRSFSYRLIATVMSQEEGFLRTALERLVETKMIYQGGVPPDATYTFRHALVQEAAYESMLRSRKLALHARIVQTIDTHFREIAEMEPEILAHHCARAELPEKAIGYWLKAGKGAVGRSANLEATNHLRSGLKLLHAIPAANDRARVELELQLTLGQASIAARGYTAIETTHAFVRAEQLAEKIGVPEQRCSALYGNFVGYLIGGHLDLAGETVSRLFQLANQGGESSHLCLAYRLLGSYSFFCGDLSTACEQLQKAVALCGAEQQRQLALRFGPNTETAAQIFLAMTEWLMGRPESASRRAETAVANARQLDHALTVGQVLTLAAQLCYMSQDYETMYRLSKEGADYCARVNILYFGTICRLYQDWAQAHLSDAANCAEAFRRDLAIYQKMKCGLQLGLFHCMLAQLLITAGEPASAVEEAETALNIVAASGERWWAPEAYRIRGEFLLALSRRDVAGAERCFRRALEEASRMGARMLELRAATSLATVLSGRGQRTEACRVLAPVYNQFSEGFETTDLRAARALLDQQLQPAWSQYPAVCADKRTQERRMSLESGTLSIAVHPE